MTQQTTNVPATLVCRSTHCRVSARRGCGECGRGDKCAYINAPTQNALAQFQNAPAQFCNALAQCQNSPAQFQSTPVQFSKFENVLMYK